MIEQLAELARPVLEFPIIRRTRRNHALEHATINVLTEHIKGLRMAGRSSESGFVLVGNVPTDEIEKAVHEALARMKRGEHRLALHPNCGTNLVTGGALTTLTGLIGLRGGSSKTLTLDRLSLTVLMMMMAILVSQPLGMTLQKHFTTKGDPGDLQVLEIRRGEMRWPFSSQPVTVHHVTTYRG
jgi:hypothetical protein